MWITFIASKGIGKLFDPIILLKKRKFSKPILYPAIIKLSGTASFSELLNLPINTIYPCCMLLFFCESGEQISERFNDIYELICRMDWYTFPIEFQRIMPIILIGTQKPIELNGFGNVPCTRENFKSVFLPRYHF